jgi:hypothetical protein
MLGISTHIFICSLGSELNGTIIVSFPKATVDAEELVFLTKMIVEGRLGPKTGRMTKWCQNQHFLQKLYQSIFILLIATF